jgi:hypothetical protein
MPTSRRPTADHDVLGPHRRPADSVEVVGQCLAQFRGAAAVEVEEPLARDLVQHPTQRAQPGRPRELRDVRAAVAEVDPQRLLGRCGELFAQPGWTDVGHLGVPAAAADQIPLGHQLRVGLHDNAAGQAEIGREQSTGRQHGTGPKVPLPDPFANACLYLAVQRRRQSAVNLDEQFGDTGRIGPDFGHGIGSYRQTDSSSG